MKIVLYTDNFCIEVSKPDMCSLLEPYETLKSVCVEGNIHGLFLGTTTHHGFLIWAARNRQHAEA